MDSLDTTNGTVTMLIPVPQTVQQNSSTQHTYIDGNIQLSSLPFDSQIVIKVSWTLKSAIHSNNRVLQGQINPELKCRFYIRPNKNAYIAAAAERNAPVLAKYKKINESKPKDQQKQIKVTGPDVYFGSKLVTPDIVEPWNSDALFIMAQQEQLFKKIKDKLVTVPNITQDDSIFKHTFFMLIICRMLMMHIST